MTEISMETALKALTDWWTEMGVAPDEATLRALRKSADGTARAAPPPSQAGQASPPQQVRRAAVKSLDTWIDEAQAAAASAGDMAALRDAIGAYEGCPLKQGSRNTVVFDGLVDAKIMVIGEGPGADEDRVGRPFIGRAGQLLDRMLAAIGISRETNAIITNVNYWRPPRNRNPEPDELAVCRPFVDRMIDLASPHLIIAAGAVPSQSLLSTTTGIMRLRGQEKTYSTPAGTTAPLFPILHPAFLLRRPQEKSRAWRDLQMIETRAKALGALD